MKSLKTFDMQTVFGLSQPLNSKLLTLHAGWCNERQKESVSTWKGWRMLWQGTISAVAVVRAWRCVGEKGRGREGGRVWPLTVGEEGTDEGRKQALWWSIWLHCRENDKNQQNHAGLCVRARERRRLIKGRRRQRDERSTRGILDLSTQFNQPC